MSHKCIVCKVTLLPWPSTIEKGPKYAKTCSISCANTLRRKGTYHVCPICGKTFYLWNSRKARGQKWCSRQCSGVAKKTGHVTRKGYRLITVDGQYIFEHRHVMAQHVGRPLTKNESVHHRDGDRLNNSIGNLELRKAYHGSGQSNDDLEKSAINHLVSLGFLIVRPEDAKQL